MDVIFSSRHQNMLSYILNKLNFFSGKPLVEIKRNKKHVLQCRTHADWKYF
jgi:hypothetical protein